MLPQASRVWGGLFLGAVALDIYCDRGEPNGDTASECIRRIFRTDTAAGKTAWTVALAVGVAWLHPHIANGPLPGSSFST